ncbi:MAG: acetate--CoA ligase family protein [Melioribacteraceae bacterium]|nr:acetate--CoA ligase family protein [Melioribacteraceae bacterium]MCF8412677.1 acetate--CoA ligase family protein [Melioribacteraceae bacterium]MCF8430977.1 acetate--CoA ligase family protein [Melioribacteraceae bacterium]
MNNSIGNFFYPASICIVGASSKEKSIGYELLKTIKHYGFTGAILPVNPKASEILGYKCYPSINQIRADIDLAVIVVPKQYVLSSIKELLDKNVKSIVLITAGFKEIGKDGEVLENQVLDVIKRSGARLIGPNCMGVINTLEEIRLNATFVAEKPATGKTAFLSQSGALGAAVLNSLRESDIKFAHFVSVGNKADINENDLISFWESDKNISTIALYLESFVDGQKFIQEFIQRTVTKPLITLKAGRSNAGMKAASSHTGALSSRDLVVDAVLKQFGIIRANDLNELFNTCKGFENFPHPDGNRIAVITNAGGPGILAVDNLEFEGLRLAQLSEHTKSELRKIVLPEASVENPVDLLPGADADLYKNVNEIVVKDKNVDAVITIFVEPVMVKPFEVVESISSIKSEKPIYQVDMTLPEFWEEYRDNSQKHIPLFKNPEDPAEIISNILFYKKQKQKIEQYSDEYKEQLKGQNSREYDFQNGFISQKNVANICNTYKIPITKDIFIKPDDLKFITPDYFPLVIKGIGANVIHKSELNAVKLDIRSMDDLMIAANSIKHRFDEFHFNLDQYQIQPYLKAKHELLIGGYRDPSFGPIIMFGTGGKYVEVICDTSTKSAFLVDEDIEEMIDSTSIGKILKGVRGEKPADLVKIKSIVKNAARMLTECGQIEEFDINPLIVTENDQIFAVDVRIKFS